MEEIKDLGRPKKIGDVLAKKEKLVEMAKKGAGKCELYIEMGITKGCASRWSSSNDDRYQPDFVNLIDELVTYSQAAWESIAVTNLWTKDFQSTVYNKQLQGRFKDDWSPHSTTDVTERKVVEEVVDLSILTEEELHQYEILIDKLTSGK